jgi:hypothetical protein
MGLSYEKRHLGLLGFQTHPGGADNLVGLVRNLTVNTTTVSTVGAALTDLHSFSLPANSLRNNGDYLHLRQKGDFAANNNLKRIVTSADGQVAFDTGLVSIGFNEWVYDYYYVRVSATSLRAAMMLTEGFITRDLAGVVGGNADILATGGLLAVSNLNNNSIVLLVRGQGTANGDVSQSLSIIEIVQN